MLIVATVAVATVMFFSGRYGAPVTLVILLLVSLHAHIRLIVLRELKHEVAPCLVATDDEAYTYSARLNRLSSIQEHFMILRAIKGHQGPSRAVWRTSAWPRS